MTEPVTKIVFTIEHVKHDDDRIPPWRWEVGVNKVYIHSSYTTSPAKAILSGLELLREKGIIEVVKDH